MGMLKGTYRDDYFDIADRYRWLKIFATTTGDTPSGFNLQACDSTGSRTNYWMWIDSNGELRLHTSEPTNEDGDGSTIGSSNAVTATAVITDHTLVRGHGGAKIVQDTSITVDDSNNVGSMGTLGCGTITIADGSSLNLQEDITFSGATTVNLIKFPDNKADALNFKNANGDSFIKIVSTTGSLDIVFGQTFTATTGSTIGNLTLANGSITDSSGTITFNDENLNTSGILTMTGDVKIDSDSKKLYFADDQGAYIYGDGTNLLFKDQTLAEKTLSELYQGTELNPLVSGDFTITDGTFTWTDATDETAATWTFANTGAGSDIDIVSSMTTGEGVHIVANDLTTGSALLIETDSIGAAGSLLDLDITVAGHNATGNFIRCYNGTGDVFEVGKYGAMTVAGTAYGTDILTATKGDITLTEGALVLSDGVIDADTDGNIGHNFATSADAAGSATTFFTITNSDVAFDQTLLAIDCNSTGAYDAIDLTYDGTAKALHITTNNAAGYGIYFDVAASHTDPLIYADLGAWLGSANEGVIHLISDSAGTVPAGQFVVLDQNGTGQHAGAIAGSILDITDAAAAPAAGTSYAVNIDATNIEAMWVNAGNIVMNTDQALQCGAASEWSTYNSGSASVTVLTTDAWTIGAAATNYASFATNGALSFAGSARPTGRLFFSPNQFTTTGGPAVGNVATSNAVGWMMSGTASELIQTSFRTPHNWASGTDLTVKIYYCANDANTKDVKWDTHSLWLTDGTDNASTGSYVVDTVTDTMAGAAYVLNVASITIAASDVKADEICVFQVERDGADAADTLDGVDVYMLGVAIEYTADSV